jgi:predicted RNase H-like HicB family nuclease
VYVLDQWEIESTDSRSRQGVPMKVQTFTAVIHREDDLYVATCPELGTVSQGATIEDALASLREATELYLEEFPIPDVGRPLLTTFEATYA